MRIKCIYLCLLAFLALAGTAQPVQQAPDWEWYLDEVVSETFVGRNYFEYYYTPSAADMEQQRAKGEVSYFLNSPEGLNSKKVRDMIDRLMASYDDIQAVGDWHMTSTTYWKEFRFERNKFRFSVKRKALDDGTYYVSVTESASYYKSLGKKNKQEAEPKTKPEAVDKVDKPTRHSTRDRKPVVVPEEKDDQTPIVNLIDDDQAEEAEPEVSAKEQRKLDAQRREAEKRELRQQQRREQEKRRQEAKAQKEAEKLKKAEEKKQREEEKRLKKEEERRLREQARLEREQERQEKAAARKQAAAPKPVESKYHCNDVALWLSEKYDFTQTAGTSASCTMFSTAVKDVEMAKLAIKNALKGSNARLAVPWRMNNETRQVETGYTVDDHVLVFTIGKNEDDNVTITITEVSNDDFETFKQSINN
ncbi:MAG: hypothetical protein IJG42_05780 [Muribaculaceae bacterium]|nr:hypothetical protein [Muribaculaceae bacterium]